MVRMPVYGSVTSFLDLQSKIGSFYTTLDAKNETHSGDQKNKLGFFTPFLDIKKS
jgi:hypothetical protein